MYKNFTLTDSERAEILNEHKKHGYKKPLNEIQELDDMIESGIIDGDIVELPKNAIFPPNVYGSIHFYRRKSNIEQHSIAFVKVTDPQIISSIKAAIGVDGKQRKGGHLHIDNNLVSFMMNEKQAIATMPKPDFINTQVGSRTGLTWFWDRNHTNLFFEFPVMDDHYQDYINLMQQVTQNTKSVNTRIDTPPVDKITRIDTPPINEARQILKKTFNHMMGLNEDVNSNWKQVCDYVKRNSVNGFNFYSFIENMPKQGVQMKNTAGEQLILNPDGSWHIYNTDGRGIKAGKWKWDGSKLVMSNENATPAANTTVGNNNIRQNIEALGKELLKFVQGKSYRFASPHDNYSIGGVVGFRVNNLADRQHTNDNLQSLSQIKKQEFMFSVTILYVELDSNNHGVVPFKKGQDAYWSVALDYNNSKFYGISNMSLWDNSIKYSMNFGPMSQTLRGKIFGELEGVLDLERKYIPQPGEVIHEDVAAKVAGGEFSSNELGAGGY